MLTKHMGEGNMWLRYITMLYIIFSLFDIYLLYMIHPNKVPFLAEKMPKKGKTDFDNLQENNFLPSFSLMS